LKYYTLTHTHTHTRARARARAHTQNKNLFQRLLLKRKSSILNYLKPFDVQLLTA